jgi:hypothetical protein
MMRVQIQLPAVGIGGCTQFGIENQDVGVLSGFIFPTEYRS